MPITGTPATGVKDASIITGQPEHEASGVEDVKPTIDLATRAANLRALLAARPPKAAILFATSSTEESRLNAEDIDIYLLIKKEPYTGTIRYDDLGDIFEKNADGVYQKTRNGFHTWVDLRAFILKAITANEKVPNIEIEIPQYNFGTLAPPEDFIRAITTRLAKNVNAQTISLTIKGSPMEPPLVLRINKNGLVIEPAQADWETKTVQEAVTNYLQGHPEHAFLYEALFIAHEGNPNASLGDYLESVRQAFNAKAARLGINIIPDNQRTQIFSRLDSLKRGLMEAAEAAVKNEGKIPSAGFIHDNPVNAFFNLHERTPNTGWFSIGAGQMIAMLEFPRHMMDIGALSLDFMLMGVDLDKYAEALIWEINEKGTNDLFLKGTPVNPEGRLPIYILNSRQRDEALKKYRPEVLLFNLQAKHLMSQFTGTLLEILQDIQPVMATPVKAYSDPNGEIPYLAIYNKLRVIDQKLADRFLVLAGFFAAPQILKGEEVDMTISGGSQEALDTVASQSSPTTLDAKTGRADWLGVSLFKFIQSVEVAAFLNAGGANKNFLTYRSGQRITKMVLRAARDTKPDTRPRADAVRSINKFIEKEARHNIDLSAEITARLAPYYGYETDHLWAPKGLETDFINCLPAACEELFHFADRFVALLKDWNLTEAKQILKEIAAKGFGLGTRNARDGEIDDLIAAAYEDLKTKIELAITDPVAFRQSIYPPFKPQEGRNGIGPLLDFAKQQGITLPAEVYETWNLYNPDRPLEVTPEKMDRDITNDDHLAWGLSKAWVEIMFQGLATIRFHLNKLATNARRPNAKFFTDGLSSLKELIEKAPLENSAIPEVARRIRVIGHRIDKLIPMIKDNSENPSVMTDAANKFQTTVSDLLKMRETTDITQLLNQLRHAIQDLYMVELAFSHGLAIKLDLDVDDDPSASTERGGNFRTAFNPTTTGEFNRAEVLGMDPATVDSNDKSGPQGSGGPVASLSFYAGAPLQPEADEALFEGALALKPKIEYVEPPKPKLVLVDDDYQRPLELSDLGAKAASNDDVEIEGPLTMARTMVPHLALSAAGTYANVIPFNFQRVLQ